jgi:hypothetical protein
MCHDVRCLALRHRASDSLPLHKVILICGSSLLHVPNAAFCIYGFCMVLNVNSDHFLKRH